MTIVTYPEKIGSIGEDLIAEHLGPAAILTREFDKYHDHDILFFAETVAVKTFQVNRKTKGFWIGENKSKTQWVKIDNTDRLYFVQVPDNKHDSIKIYLCPDHKNAYTMEHRNDGTPVRCYPISKLTLVDTVYDKSLSEHMFNMSCNISKWRTK
jgi:hypothetical protein